MRGEIDKSDLLCWEREWGIIETAGVKWSENRYEKFRLARESNSRCEYRYVHDFLTLGN